MSPIQTGIREKSPSVRAYPPADVPFSPPKDDTWREIVVDWQLPSDAQNRRT